jgi:hypothetical protein
MKWWMMVVLVLGMGAWCAAAETHREAASVEHAQESQISYPHPTLSEPYLRWPGCVLIGIATMFLAAMVIGPVVRAEVPEEVPPAHSHDEPPGTSGHHGRSGTVQPGPEHDQGHH